MNRPSLRQVYKEVLCAAYHQEKTNQSYSEISHNSREDHCSHCRTPKSQTNPQKIRVRETSEEEEPLLADLNKGSAFVKNRVDISWGKIELSDVLAILPLVSIQTFEIRISTISMLLCSLWLYSCWDVKTI